MSKTQRAEQMLTEKQRATLWKLHSSGNYEPENLAERYGMSETEFEWYIVSMQAEHNAKQRKKTDWAARFAEHRAAT
ncbi:hypothetical protein KYK29_03225 [Shinella daejeonensis]|uniref:hypothetical protein n=1 Tax=Shinella daejeonensis TaxID=659017 RepID=UPI0020C7ADAD|nr:hypothetical protein [Shinella daejeonensis]MCP8893927.1 hypothetical protein [Shinella daejeonensis]